MDKVFNVVEDNPYYTIFEEVELEDVDEEFFTAEEMKEHGNTYQTSFSVGTYNDNKTGYVNKKEIRKAATEASNLFKNRGKKGGKLLKTIPYPLDFDDTRAQDIVRMYFRSALEKRNLKYVGGRVRADTKEKEAFNKNSARKGMIHGLKLLIMDKEKGFGVDLKLREAHIIIHQRRYCKFAEKLGISHQDVMDYIDDSKSYYLETAKKEVSHEYLKEFWAESLTFVEEVEAE